LERENVEYILKFQNFTIRLLKHFEYCFICYQVAF